MIEFPDLSWRDYELIDSGGGEKLERFGPYVLCRPEPKALWDSSLPRSEWDRLAHTRFKPGAGFGKAGKEDSGTWERLRKMDDQWWIRYAFCTSPDQREIKERSDSGGFGGNAPRPLGVQGDNRPSGRAEEFALRLGLTSFKHVGVFPEQAPNWDFIYRKCRSMQAPKVLNLFAYTGAASLAARAAGAEVTHLDSVRQVVTWARGNMERSGMDGIRWVVEDAMKFALRESRRGHLYDGIILDPPAYGHGPDGEKWKLDECLFEMLRTVASILKPQASFVVLNLYSNGYSAALGETLVREAFGLTGARSADSVPEGLRVTDFASLIPASGRMPTIPLHPQRTEGRSPLTPPVADAPEPQFSDRSIGAVPEGLGVADRLRPRSREWEGPAPSGVGGMSEAKSVTPSPSGTVITSGELALNDSFGKVLPLSIVVRLEK